MTSLIDKNTTLYNPQRRNNISNVSMVIALFFCILETALGSLYIMTKGINDLEPIGYFLILNFFCLLIFWKMLSGKVFSSFFFLIVFLYILHFGQVIVDGVFPSYKYDYLDYVHAYMENDSLQRTILVCFLTTNLMFLGGAFEQLCFARREKTAISKTSFDLSKNCIKKLFVFSFVFRFILDCFQLSQAIYAGYAGANDVSFSGIFSAIAGMWYAVVPLMYLFVSNSKKKTYVLLCVCYMAITMLTGNRGHQFTSILMLLIVIITDKGIRIGFLQLLKYLFLGYIAMVFLDVIFAMRTNGIQYFLNNFTECIVESLKANILLETIGTFGETLFTPYLTIVGYGVNFKPFFGECFCKSIFSIVPDVFGWFAKLNNEAIFTKNLGTQNAIGGSYIAELYYNFGIIYPLFALLSGMYFAKISRKIEDQIRGKDYAGLWLDIPFMTYSFWLMRDCIGNFVRPIVWFAVFYLILARVLVKKSYGDL